MLDMFHLTEGTALSNIVPDSTVPIGALVSGKVCPPDSTGNAFFEESNAYTDHPFVHYHKCATDGEWIYIIQYGSTLTWKTKDGVKYFPMAPLPSASQWTGFGYNNGVLFAYAFDSTTAYRSFDKGNSWVSYNMGQVNRGPVHTFCGKFFVNCGNEAKKYRYSVDTANWTTITASWTAADSGPAACAAMDDVILFLPSTADSTLEYCLSVNGGLSVTRYTIAGALIGTSWNANCTSNATVAWGYFWVANWVSASSINLIRSRDGITWEKITWDYVNCPIGAAICGLIFVDDVLMMFTQDQTVNHAYVSSNGLKWDKLFFDSKYNNGSTPYRRVINSRVNKLKSGFFMIEHHSGLGYKTGTKAGLFDYLRGIP